MSTGRDLENWLDSLGLSKYLGLFQENEIDWDVIPELGAEDLQELGLPLGPRKKLLKAIGTLGETPKQAGPTLGLATTHNSSTPEDGAQDSVVVPGAERRQLTVVFCDLIGSTELSAQMDPEDMAAMLRDYQDRVQRIVKLWDGHVARYMGDGVLAYFGYPRAHEDDVERAVRASLEITATVATMTEPGGTRLAARVGVATGLVIVGELIGEGEARERAVVGQTPNLAARLQGLAPAGSVVLAPSTRHLLGGLCDLEDMGSHQLRGIPEPVQAWRVLGPSAAESRFDAHHGKEMAALVGREHEIGLMLDRFELARGGEGQVVLLSGEAGIGKSRVTKGLHERLAGVDHLRMQYYCSPYHTNSSLHPIVEQLNRAIGRLPEHADEDSLQRLEALLVQAGVDIAEALPLLAALCSIPVGDRYRPMNLSPQAQKERTFNALLDQLAGLGAKRPVLMVLEDAHWIDPTSRDLFGRVIDRVQDLSVLLLITFRPEFNPPWSGYPHVTSLNLSRLGQRQCSSIVEQVTGGKPLPVEILDQIIRRTDGVPLFIEELTKTVLESGLIESAGDHYVLTGNLDSITIPTTLHDSLTARLDSLAPIKELAQIGAVIGREFSHRLMAEVVAPMPEEKLLDSLNQLVSSELVFRRGTPPDATYTFKHALVQDAAYQSLLKSRLQQLHGRIAQVLEERFGEIANNQPELLAYHCTEAGMTIKAIDYWRSAGERAARRAAASEAVEHFQKALNLLELRTEGRERDAAELKVLIQFGPALMLTQGWASAEVGAMYARAAGLARDLKESVELVAALVGSWLYYQGSAQYDAADSATAELFSLGRALDDSDLLLQAEHAAWPIPMLRGDFAPSYEHIERGLCLYDNERHSQHAFVYMGHDPAVCAHALGAVVAWNLGYLDRARLHAEDAVALANSLDHPPSLALALWFITGMHAARGDSLAALAGAERLARLSEEQKLVQTYASAQILGGWALAHQGQPKEGAEQLQAGLDTWHRMGARHYLPAFNCLLAESALQIGRHREAAAHLQEALSIAGETGEGWWISRIHLTRSQLMLHEDGADRELASASLQSAVRVARGQGALGLELRASHELSLLLQEAGKRREAQELLGPLLDTFIEGTDSTELRQARELLEALR